MAKAAKKKAKVNKKSARVTSKSSKRTMAAKPKAKPTKKAAKPAGKKSAARKIDPLNRKNYGALTPMLAVKDVRRAVDFYVNAFGFKVRGIMDGPEGPMHAELRIRDTTLMLSPESREQQNFSANSIGGTPATLYILVENVDSTFKSAVAAGGNVIMPVMDMFWGDRVCMIGDPDGNKWMLATHKAEPTEAQMAEAMKRQMSQGGGESAHAASAGSESEY